jgi:hypothetical protein
VVYHACDDQAASQLNATFHTIAPTTLKLMGVYIRKNQSEFVLIED